MRFADPILLQDLSCSRTSERCSRSLIGGTDPCPPAVALRGAWAHLKSVAAADPGPEQPRHKVKSRSTRQSPRHSYPWTPIRIGTSLERTLGTYWARTWGSDSA